MNIFENAKFGDKFRTRDGRTALYIQEYYSNLFQRNIHELLHEDEGFEDYDADGSASVHGVGLPIDIVGKWEEPINEEELDNLAWSEYPDYSVSNMYGDVSGKELHIKERNAFKAGYRKAKEVSPNYNPK